MRGNSSPGNANLRIGTQAGEGENSHPDLQRKYVLRHTYKVTDLKRPCQYGDWRSQAGGFYVLSQSILVWDPYKSQVEIRVIRGYVRANRLITALRRGVDGLI